MVKKERGMIVSTGGGMPVKDENQQSVARARICRFI